jgi:hypothetical protein
VTQSLSVPETIFIDHEITLHEVRKIARRNRMIYYGANTPWWTANDKDMVYRSGQLPCDPRGGMLFQTDDVEGFLVAASKPENAQHYGKHGIRVFMLAYHGCVVAKTPEGKVLPTCLNSWEQYSELLDRKIANG